MWIVSRSGVWGGRTTLERRTERRERMIAAAISIWSEEGWAAVSMRRICAQTSLNDRYFYDEFVDRDGLLVAVWEQIQDDVLGAVTAAYQQRGSRTSWEDLTRTATRAFVDRIVAEPLKAKILLSRNEGSPVLEAVRRKAFQRSIGIVMAAARPRMKSGYDEQALEMDAIVSVGGFVELIRTWQSGHLNVDADQIVDYTCGLAAKFSGRRLPLHDGATPLFGLP
jgi:AcrR family transcriptional regulator